MYATKCGKATHKSAGFLPNFSAMNPNGSVPIMAPMLILDPIQLSSSFDIGLPKGFLEESLEYSFGYIGDVHVDVMSPERARRSTETDEI